MDVPVIIVQARFEASRLPGKMLLPILGQPLILHLLDRLNRTGLPIICALPATPDSDPLFACLRRHGYQTERPDVHGNEVLGRYAAVAIRADTDTIIRVTGDCVLIDPDLVTEALACYQRSRGTLAYVALAKEWPDGLDVEVVSKKALLEAHDCATLTSDREHVTPWIWRQSDRYPSLLLACPFSLGTEKWSVDDTEDLTLVRRIYERLYPIHGRAFGWREIYGLIATEPKIKARIMQQPRNQGYMRQIAQEQGRSPDDESWESRRYGIQDDGEHPRSSDAPHAGRAE